MAKLEARDRGSPTPAGDVVRYYPEPPSDSSTDLGGSVPREEDVVENVGTWLRRRGDVGVVAEERAGEWTRERERGRVRVDDRGRRGRRCIVHTGPG